jgi:hypothetical protein
MTDVHASDAPMVGEPHGLGDHGEDHGHDDHAHAGEGLGPIDWPAYGAGALGVLIGIVISWAFIVSKLVASP